MGEQDLKAKRRALNRVNDTEHWLLRHPSFTGWLIAGLLVLVIVWTIEAFG